MKNRGFEKVSLEQFKKDCLLVNNVEETYNNIILPKRATKHSAGYDIHTPISFSLEPGSTFKVPLGIKSYFNGDEVLQIYVRSSIGFKYNVRMCNQVGIIDSDYYNNPGNEGHLFVKLQNEGKETITFKAGDRIVQGIFTKYLICDDDETTEERNSGIGSTGK